MRAGPQIAWTLGLLAVLAACGDDTSGPPTARHCAAHIRELCDVLEPSCQADLLTYVECMRETRLDPLPPVFVSTSDVVRNENFGSLSVEDAEVLERYGRGLALLGLYDDERTWTDAAGDTSAGLVAAFYDPSTRSVTLIEDVVADSPDYVNMEILVHEYVHAVQDQEHGLNAMLGATRDRDEEMALRTAVEGEATYLQLAFEAALFGVEIDGRRWISAHEELLGRMDRAVEDSNVPLLISDAYFPYVYGSQWAREQWVRGGADALRAALVVPPATTRVFVASDRGETADGRAFDDMAWRDAVTQVTSPDGFITDSARRLGAQHVMTAVGVHTPDAELPITLAGAWQADTFVVLYHEDADRVAVVWVVRLGSDDDAVAFAELLAGVADVVSVGPVVGMFDVEGDGGEPDIAAYRDGLVGAFGGL